MRLKLLAFEFKKILEQPMIIIFLGLCWVCNITFIVSINLDQQYLSQVESVRQSSGNRMDANFKRKISELPVSKDNQRLVNDVESAKNIYTSDLKMRVVEDMHREFRINNSLVTKLEKKYQLFQPVISHLYKENVAFDLAGASETTPYFSYIRFFLLRFVLIESSIFAILIGLFSSTSEKMTKTESVVLTTKTGRSVQISKYLAGMMLSGLFFILVTLISFGVFFAFHPFGGFGESSVSTQFHQNMYSLGKLGTISLPFMTWFMMSFKGYIVYSLGFSLLLVIILFSSQFLLGLWIGNLFKGFILTSTLFMLHKGVVAVAMKYGFWHFFSGLMFSPFQVWETQPFWFTEMGPFTILPLQEIWVVLFMLIILVISLFNMKNYYLKKEVY